MRVVCWLPSNSLIDRFYFSFGNVWCNFWAVFLTSHGHRLVIFILECHFLCLEATTLGMCYTAKQQLRNRIRQGNLTCYTFYLGAFVTCGWDARRVFVIAAVIQQLCTTTIPACQGLPANTGIIFSTLTLTFCPLLITAQDVSDNPEFFRACCRKDTTFVYTAATFALQPSQISAVE